MLKKAVTGDQSKLNEGFEALAKASRKLENILIAISKIMVQNMLTLKELDNVTAIVFYVYEVSVEEERDLWIKYKERFNLDDKNLEEHFARVDRIKLLTERILEAIEGNR